MFTEVRAEDADASAEFGWRPNVVGPFQCLTQSQVLQEWALAGSATQIAPYLTSIPVESPRSLSRGSWSSSTS
jgi:hypothetical protein